MGLAQCFEHLEHACQMRLQDVRGLCAVACPDRIQEPRVLIGEVDQMPLVMQTQGAHPVEDGFLAGDRGPDAAQTCRIAQAAVKGVVGVVEPLAVGLGDGGMLVGDCMSQPRLDRSIKSLAAKLLNTGQFERLTDSMSALDVAHREPGHKGAARWLRDDQAFVAQKGQSLAHWGAGGPEMTPKLPLGQATAGGDLHGQDHLSQGVRDLMARWLVRIERRLRQLGQVCHVRLWIREGQKLIQALETIPVYRCAGALTIDPAGATLARLATAGGRGMARRDRELGVAMIGAGMVARTHALALEEASTPLRLCGVLTRSPETARIFLDGVAGQMRKTPVVYPDIAAIADDPGVDIALVLTPPDARADLVAPLVQAGKAILLEKPVGRTLAEAREVVALCAAAQVPLGIVFQHRMREASIAARELVASDALGALGLVEITVPWWRDQSYYDAPGRGTYARDGGGVLISQAIHTLDLALSLAGPVERVTSFAATTRFHTMETEDFVTAGLQFANGAVGSLTASTASFPGQPERITLHFEAATLHLGEGVLKVQWRDGRQSAYGASASTGGGADPMAFTHAWHQSVIEDFADALRTGRAPQITGQDALAAHALIEAILESARNGVPVTPEVT